MCNNNGELAGNPGKEHISFRSGMVSAFSSGSAHIDFKMVDGTFHYGSDFVQFVPFFGIPLDAGEHTEIHVLVSVSGAAFFGSAAWMFTFAKPLSFPVTHFGASPLDTVRAPFLPCQAKIFHGKGRVIGAGGITVLVVTDFFESAFIARVIRDECFGEAEIMEERTIYFGGIKGRITEENIGMETGMKGEIIREDRD